MKSGLSHLPGWPDQRPSPLTTLSVRNGLFYGEASLTFILSMFYRETHRYTFLFLDIYKYGQPPVYIGLEYEWEIGRNLSSQGMESKTVLHLLQTTIPSPASREK